MPRRISPTARRRRPLAVLTAVLVVLVGAWGWFAATKIYFPRLDQAPENADVLVQVGGIPWKDYQTARDTARRLGIPDLVLSDPSSGTEVHDRYCGPLEGVRVHCFAPDPSTTRGEARGFAELAATNDWHSAYVLSTGREHVERARLYFSRCWGGELAVNRPASGRAVTVHLKQSFYQTAGWIKAMKDSAC